jgi:Mg-chelatase subunit ChlD
MHGVRTWALIGSLLATTVPAAFACAAGEGELRRGSADGGAGGSGSSGGFGAVGASSAGGSSAAGGTGIRIEDGGPGGEEDAPACFEQATDGERLPMDMFMIYDTSGSMNESVNGSTRMDIVRNALITFLNDPQSADIGTGIMYFPKTDPAAPTSCTTTTDCQTAQKDYGQCLSLIPFVNLAGCPFPPCACTGADACNVGVYAQPDVPITLPANPAPVIASLQAQRTGGFTPLRYALEGAHTYAATWAQEHPGRKTIVVLVGDGDPQGCLNGNAIADSENVVRAALNGPQQIPTFVVGVGDSVNNLNQVAAAGGTGQAYLMSDAQAATQFTEAMDDIRGRAFPCVMVIPEDQTLDPAKLNIEFTPRDATQPQLVARTHNGREDGCGNGEGWYYDDPDNPTQIGMCPATCNIMTSGEGRRLTMKLGCTTVIQPPPE